MRVEQAVFTSAQSRTLQGYHLVARSSGIDDMLARKLIPWGPSHAALAVTDPDACSLNFHPLGDRHLVLSRTVCGGPEYSGRGVRLFTRFLIFEPDLLDGYGGSPLVLARSALALGYLRFETDLPPQLPCVHLVPRPLAGGCGRWVHGSPSEFVEELLRIALAPQPCAVVGPVDPMEVLAEVFDHVADRRRREISFTTRLKPSRHRPFLIHFLPEADVATQHRLAAEGLVVLPAGSPAEFSEA